MNIISNHLFYFILPCILKVRTFISTPCFYLLPLNLLHSSFLLMLSFLHMCQFTHYFLLFSFKCYPYFFPKSHTSSTIDHFLLLLASSTFTLPLHTLSKPFFLLHAKTPTSSVSLGASPSNVPHSSTTPIPLPYLQEEEEEEGHDPDDNISNSFSCKLSIVSKLDTGFLAIIKAC